MNFLNTAFSFLTKRPPSINIMPLSTRNFQNSATSLANSQASVVLVGCGAPNRGMGWYHAIQLIDKQCPSATLDYVVEPWFLGPGRDSADGKEFGKCQLEWEDKHGIMFLKSLQELPRDTIREHIVPPRLTLLSGRTADNPRLFKEAIDAGSQSIYLEKPGAPTVKELQLMKEQAQKNNVRVFMGYNKNVSKYVCKTREFMKNMPNSKVKFVSNNAYENTEESLGECFERNCEGMLKNMVIHELALLVCFYGAKVDNIQSVQTNKEFSSLQTLVGPSGNFFTDFDKIQFTLTMRNGTQVSVQADRCGGSDSYAMIEVGGKEVQRYTMPDQEDKDIVKKLEKKYPTAMPYFFTQDADYQIVKEKVAKNLVDGSEAEGIATIEEAIETLKVAEYLTEVLKEQLK